jgi:hypothetical protein
MTHHDALWVICKELPEDYEPYGKAEREGGDCSCNCKWFYSLEEKNGEDLGADWGVCSNPVSHRCGLLTFEHQGCRYFEAEQEDDDEEEPEFL